MAMRLSRMGGFLLPVVFLMLAPCAQAVLFHTINFEGLADLTSVTNQYSAQDVSFSNSTVLTAGISLNEFEFPPLSGQNVVFDDAGAMRIDFGLTTYDWAAYFTYTAPLTIRAWDASNNLLGIVNSAYSENFVTSANAPNEQLSFASLGGFRSITIEGSATGGSFVMDNMSYTTEDAPNAVPEPGTMLLLASGLVTTGLVARKKVFRP
jgi:hypothetical protein